MNNGNASNHKTHNGGSVTGTQSAGQQDSRRRRVIKRERVNEPEAAARFEKRVKLSTSTFN
jgi:hypothetical protein